MSHRQDIPGGVQDVADRIPFVSESRICELAGRGFCKLKLGGRNAPMPKVMDMLGAYVFEPTGAFCQIRTTVMREYRELAERRGAPLAPFALP